LKEPNVLLSNNKSGKKVKVTPDYIPQDAENMSNETRAILEREGFVHSMLQKDEGQLWGLIKDDFPREGLQLHVRAFLINGKLRFLAHTEPSRYTFEHMEERLRSYPEGLRIFIEIMRQYGIEITYEGNILDLYVTPERPRTLTSWVPLAIVGGIILVFIVADSLGKPPKEQ